MFKSISHDSSIFQKVLWRRSFYHMEPIIKLQRTLELGFGDKGVKHEAIKVIWRLLS